MSDLNRDEIAALLDAPLPAEFTAAVTRLENITRHYAYFATEPDLDGRYDRLVAARAHLASVTIAMIEAAAKAEWEQITTKAQQVYDSLLAKSDADLADDTKSYRATGAGQVLAAILAARKAK